MARLIDLVKSRNHSWNLVALAENPNISLNDINEINQMNGMNKIDKSRCPHLQFKDVLDDLTYNWDWEYLSKHQNITIDIIKKYNCFK